MKPCFSTAENIWSGAKTRGPAVTLANFVLASLYTTLTNLIKKVAYSSCQCIKKKRLNRIFKIDVMKLIFELFSLVFLGNWIITVTREHYWWKQSLQQLNRSCLAAERSRSYTRVCVCVHICPTHTAYREALCISQMSDSVWMLLLPPTGTGQY